MSRPIEGETAPAASPRRPSHVRATWVGEHRFDTGRPDGPITRLDGSAESGQTPPDAVLSALAACSGIDVVDIMAKRRTPVERLTVDVTAERREEPPRRFTHVAITYRVDGPGIEAVHVERAVTLAFEKYCSVAASLAQDLVVETIAVVNGTARAAVGQRIPN